MKLALRWFVPVALTAMGLAWISEQVALLLGFEPPPQDLVRIFTNPKIVWTVKAKLALYAVVAAPVIEELIFRMGLFNFFNWLGKKFSKQSVTKVANRFPIVSALVSGAIFAAVHLHAATFPPLWFLGVAFAWLYWKSGSICSPMLCHFLFNLVNLLLCLTVGAEA